MLQLVVRIPSGSHSSSGPECYGYFSCVFQADRGTGSLRMVKMWFHVNANPSKWPLHPRNIYAIHPVSRQRHHIQLEADEDASPTVLSRVQAFLPELAASNADLLQRAREDPSSVDIESVNAEDPQYIEMVRTYMMLPSLPAYLASP